MHSKLNLLFLNALLRQVVELSRVRLRGCFRGYIEIVGPLVNLQEKLLDTLEAINMHGLRKDFVLVVENLI